MSTEQPGQQEEWNVRRILNWTTEHLRQHGSESPRVEAEILLAHARKCDRIQLYTSFDEPLSDEERSVMRDLVKRRANAEPVAYLVGYKEFFSLRFAVSSDVLIPRPETELMVMEALEFLKDRSEPRLLDLCTGSGCITISAVKNLSKLTSIATDLSPDALRIASQNAEQFGVTDRIEFLNGDLFAPLSDDEKFDVIATNPPYITDDEWEQLSPDVKHHEPKLALAAGSDGLDLIRRIAGEAPQYLRSGGLLMIEIDPAQEAPLHELLGSWATEIRSIHDLNKSVRFVVATAS